MMEKLKNFWNDGLSVDESRVSIVVLGFVLSLGILLYTYLRTGVIHEYLLDLVKFEIGAITGINITSSVASLFKKNEDKNAVG